MSMLLEPAPPPPPPAADGVPEPAVDIPAFLAGHGLVASALPCTALLLIEFLLRNDQFGAAMQAAVELAGGRQPHGLEIAFLPARLIMQDYTGIPALADLAALRDELAAAGRDPCVVNPVLKTDIVVDHSLIVESAGTRDALAANQKLEMLRNQERYDFLAWAAGAFDRVNVIPSGQGIVHQINMEQLATLVVRQDQAGRSVLYPDSVIGTDSHTTMANGMGILGWGVGGLEAEALMAGMPVRMPFPRIVGIALRGSLGPGISSADLVLGLTNHLRKAGVVGDLLEFFGEGVRSLDVPERCTIANMAPEYGAMGAYFAVDERTVAYLEITGRSKAHCALVERYYRHQGLWAHGGGGAARYPRTLVFDLDAVERCVAGPSNPHEWLPLKALPASLPRSAGAPPAVGLADGAIALAAITSCTHTANPTAMLTAGLLARNAVACGLRVRPHVKTSFAPGSQAVVRYMRDAGLIEPMEALGFHVVGFACATCNGGGGELHGEMARAIEQYGIAAASVSSGNRNFPGRIHPLLKANYLASPALVVAFALAGTLDLDVEQDALGMGRQGPVFLRQIWPSDEEVAALKTAVLVASSFPASQAPMESLQKRGGLFPWREASDYLRRPPYFDADRPQGSSVVEGARALLVLGDDISTDHISPVGMIAPDSPAGTYLTGRGVAFSAFNSYGSRRSNHEVMVRGAFANPRLHNHLLADGRRGGMTIHQPSEQVGTVFDIAGRYAAAGVPMVIVAGENYGVGSSRDWAARAPALLGVTAVLARSFERIHRSNLIAMGVLPVQLCTPEEDMDWSGYIAIRPVAGESIGIATPMRVTIISNSGKIRHQDAITRLDSSDEVDILRDGGLLPRILSRLMEVSYSPPATPDLEST
ncbi:aconitate hydratase [Xanthomonas bromi]|uniref:aconitate hydratase n=1 Tax=Xanthomonas bromi TaxID=56449 RepID=A0A1C3NR56_9XANT|nr:aconitate hydratase AcnA [Xanthomonas bromi]PPV05198.1 aconitate hydratase AcnA [Xanthomonas bromi]SBV52876.1 aconitate hydratase [Xanthomonas bromi]